jgi:hypothetical protein
MLGLVAPITMSADQCTVWLASAEDALADIRASEVAEVSMEVRRSVTRPSQIVPEIAKVVAAHRVARSRVSELVGPKPENALPPPPKHIMERDRRGFTANDWAELNAYLESMGSPVRYAADGRKIAA